MFNSYSVNALRCQPSACTGCRLCSSVGPHGVFAENGGKAELVRPEACMECGACLLNCPTGGIQVEIGVGRSAAMTWAALRGRQEGSCGGNS